ncbi:hypothetical protein Tco_1470930 [Tanacetum coccineum]
MSAITDVKCVLTQKALDAFCNKFHIPEDVHPVLPNQNDTMHKRPAGKIGWMLFSKRFDNASVCYTKPLDSLKNWNDHFFWVDDFDCPTSFSWLTAKHMTRDPAPVSADFNAQDYATLVAHPSPNGYLCFHPYPGSYQTSVERFFDKCGSGNQTEQGDSAGGGQDANIQPVVEAADTAVENMAPVQPRRQGKENP